MNKMRNKLVSRILLVCIIFTTILPQSAMAAENGVQTRLNSVLDDFPVGSYFTTDGQKDSRGDLISVLKARGLSTNGFEQSNTCVAFAKYAWAKIFGHNITPPYRNEIGSGRAGLQETWKDAKPGDLIYFYETSSMTPFKHAAIVWSISSSGVTILDCNYTHTNQIKLYTVTFGGGGWPFSYCRIYRSKNYDEVNGIATQNYVVTFNANGGSVSQTSKEVKAGNTIGTMPTPTREGYTFVGWTNEPNSSSSMIITSNNFYVDQNLTLYALWRDNTPKYMITFDANGGEVSSSTLWVTYGKTYNSLPTPTWDGYTFDGWYTTQTSGTKITSSTTVNLTGNQTLYAHWTAIPSKTNTETTSTQVTSKPSQYTVVLDDGSTCSRITVTNGETYAGLTTPSKDGYTFDGWYTSASGGTKITASTVVALTGDQTLYAHWTKKSVEWSAWSEWSSTPVAANSTRQVETKQVKVSDAYTEYRYGRYVDSTRTHDCWCSKYLEGLSYVSGSATLQYSSWSTTQYKISGKSWSCGYCTATHIGADHKSSDGRLWWAEYLLPDGSYYWKESRQVAATYQTMYRYRTIIE